jgi:hypothetical protein
MSATITRSITNTIDGVLYEETLSTGESGSTLLKKTARIEDLSLDYDGKSVTINYSEEPVRFKYLTVSSFTGVSPDGKTFNLSINGKSFSGVQVELFKELKAVLAVAFAGKASF